MVSAEWWIGFLWGFAAGQFVWSVYSRWRAKRAMHRPYVWEEDDGVWYRARHRRDGVVVVKAGPSEDGPWVEVDRFFEDV